MTTQTIARFEGTQEMIQNLENVTNRVRNKGLKAGLLAAAEIVRSSAAARAPRGRTGKLSGEMTIVWEGRRHRAKVGPSAAAFYGDFVERGTSKMGARPFLRPALDSNREECFAVMAKELKQAVEAKR